MRSQQLGVRHGKSMRMLFLNNEFPPLGGGTATVTYELLREFAKQNEVEIDLITSAGTSSKSIEKVGKSVTIHKLPLTAKCIHHASNYELLRYAWSAYWYSLELHKAHPFALTLAFCTVPAGFAALLLKKRAKIPYIVRLSGPDIPGFEARYNWLYPILKPVLRKIWAGSSRIIAKCKEEADLLSNTFSPGSKLQIIPNGVDTALFSPPTSVPQRDPSEPINVLCVARLIERKGQGQLIRALAKLKGEGKNVKLTLVGEGDSEQAYRELTRELQVTEQVEFKGYIPRENLPAIYHAADIFALISENEGMSLALLEALACGLPIITTPTGGVKELNPPQERCRIVRFGNTSNIIAAIDELARIRPHTDCLESSRSNYSAWSDISRQYQCLFEQSSSR